MTSEAAPTAEVRTARLGVFGIFALCGVSVGMWGAVVAPTSALMLIGPALAPSYPVLVATCVAFGAGTGALDVSMNAHAVHVEQRWPRPVLSAFHGVWSLGGVVGGTVVAAGLYWGANVQHVMVAGAVVSAALFRLATSRLLREEQARCGDTGARADAGAGDRLPLRLVIALGVVASCSFLSEGAAMDWSALHANRVLGAELSSASLAYIMFTAAMTVTRLFGDRARHRLGPVTTLRRAGCTAVAGYGLVLLAPVAPDGVYVGYAGWFLAGLGLALVVPVVFAGAGASSGGDAGSALSKVTTFGYVGMLAGPSVIGPLGEATSLAAAMALPAVLCTGLALGGPVALRRVLARRESSDVGSRVP